MFDAIAEAGNRLLGMRVGLNILRDDGRLHYVGHAGVSAEHRAALAKLYPLPLDRESVVGTCPESNHRATSNYWRAISGLPPCQRTIGLSSRASP